MSTITPDDDTRVIFTDGGAVKVIHDGSTLPIGITVEAEDADPDYGWLTEAEATALVAGLISVLNLPPLGGTVVVNNAGTAETPTTVFEVDGDERLAWNIDAFAAASRHKRVASFRYAKGDGGQVESRRLRPFGPPEEKGGHLIVTGTDPDRGDDIRAYRLDRVTDHVNVGGAA